jgi:hypothetical protein
LDRYEKPGWNGENENLQVLVFQSLSTGYYRPFRLLTEGLTVGNKKLGRQQKAEKHSSKLVYLRAARKLISDARITT